MRDPRTRCFFAVAALFDALACQRQDFDFWSPLTPQIPKLLSQLFSGAVFTRFARSVLEPELLKNLLGEPTMRNAEPLRVDNESEWNREVPCGELVAGPGRASRFQAEMRTTGSPVVAL